jgi:predicted ATP-dependent serine protease
LARRLAEAERMGFRRAIVPAASEGLDGLGAHATRSPQPGDDPTQLIEAVQVRDIRQALAAVLGHVA